MSINPVELRGIGSTSKRLQVELAPVKKGLFFNSLTKLKYIGKKMFGRSPNYNWSEPETKGPFLYTNRFGEVELIPVTEFMPISEISRDKLDIVDEVSVSIDMAEKVVLITDNRRMSMSFHYPFQPEDRATYALKYSCSNRAAVCRVNLKSFKSEDGRTAQEQIEHMAPKISGPMPVF
jgi:hypothetical protein